MQDLVVVALQYEIVWKDREANMAKCEMLLSNISGVDLIVLPEMFQTGFCFDKEALAEREEDSPTIAWMTAIAHEKQAVVTGSLMVKKGDLVYNRLIWMTASGDYQTYDKRHLFSMSDEPQHFAAGSEKLIVELKGWKICPMICYDLRFPVWIRNTEMYDLLIFVANWPEKRSEHWEKLLQARAIENQCFVIGVNRVGADGNNIPHDGRSAIINPQGNVLETALVKPAILQQALQQDEIIKTRRYMPFLKDADRFTLD